MTLSTVALVVSAANGCAALVLALLQIVDRVRGPRRNDDRERAIGSREGGASVG
jgi:hypothetical protein